MFNNQSSKKQEFKVEIKQVFNILAALSFSTIPHLCILFISGIWIFQLSHTHALIYSFMLIIKIFSLDLLDTLCLQYVYKAHSYIQLFQALCEVRINTALSIIV